MQFHRLPSSFSGTRTTTSKGCRVPDAHHEHALVTVAIIKEGIETGVFEAGNPALAARAIMGMLQWVKRWYKPSGALGVDSVTEEFCELALRMLGARSGGLLR